MTFQFRCYPQNGEHKKITGQDLIYENRHHPQVISCGNHGPVLHETEPIEVDAVGDGMGP